MEEIFDTFILHVLGFFGLVGCVRIVRIVPVHLAQEHSLSIAYLPPMFITHHRRRATALYDGTARTSGAGRIVVRWLILLLVVYVLGSWTLRLFGWSGNVQRAAVTLRTEDAGSVNVSIEGEDQQRAENGMKLYEDDAVSTGPGGHASMLFADGTVMRLNDGTDVAIVESDVGEKESSFTVSLKQGSIWVKTPAQASLSGSVVRTVQAASITWQLPADTEALIEPQNIRVFSADGLGVNLKVRGKDPVMIGEGQQWNPADVSALGDDLYAYRSPLDTTAIASTFVRDSRLIGATAGGSSSSSAPSADMLTITSPEPDSFFTGQTVMVSGRIGAEVSKVSVNGHAAVVDGEAHTFRQEYAPEQGSGDIEIRVQAFNAQGAPIADVKRILRRATPTAQAAPSIDAPAKAGQTYRTQAEEIVLRGTAPTGATGIMVNDYQLRLFDPEKGSWSYLAALRVGNLKPGLNVFNVTALYGDTGKSEPVTIQILHEEGPQGVVTGPVTSASSSSVLDPRTLPTNAPLQPGSLTVTAPVAGTSAVLTGTGFLIEGNTSAATATLWVNDYRLQLYKAGKTTWNYIASLEFANLKKGTNVYRIVARNKDNQIVDVLEYTVELE